jgi:hypothetical protein
MKGKSIYVHAMTSLGGGGELDLQLHLFLTSALDGGE